MHATSPKHEQFSPRQRNRLKTTIMGLGLARLLQDVGRSDEARDVLAVLQNGANGAPAKPTRKLGKGKRMKFASRNILGIVPGTLFELVP